MQNFYEMFGAYKFYYYFCPVFRAQMAESVDALVSNTSGFTSMPVRSRLWVLNGESSKKDFPFLFIPRNSDKSKPLVL